MRNWNAKFVSVFENGYTFIVDVEDTDDRFNSDITVREISVDEVSDANESKYEAFASNAFEACWTGQIIFDPTDNETR